MEKATEPTEPAKDLKDGKPESKIKTRQGSGYLKQLYATARVTSDSTHHHLKNLTTFLVNFIPTDKIDASELQVRTHFDDQEISALAHSIKEHGVLQPILVVQDGDRYKVIAGERRLRASKQAGMERIPARVLSTNDKATHEIALRENLDRVDLHPLEEGEGYVSLLEAQLYPSHDAIAQAFGKPKSRITECVGFTKLPILTKNELLRVGLKNRALLRQLLNTPIDQHLSIIQEATGKEEQIFAPVPGEAAVDGSSLKAADGSATKTAPTEKAIRPFTYRCETKGVVVPGFRWKAGEGAPKLEQYVATLKQLLVDLERQYPKK